MPARCWATAFAFSQWRCMRTVAFHPRQQQVRIETAKSPAEIAQLDMCMFANAMSLSCPVQFQTVIGRAGLQYRVFSLLTNRTNPVLTMMPLIELPRPPKIWSANGRQISAPHSTGRY